MAPPSPCYKCPNHALYCRNTCADWDQYQTDLQEYNSVVHKARSEYLATNMYYIDNNVKCKRLRNMYKRKHH